MRNNSEAEISALEEEQAATIEAELAEVMTRAIREGFDARIVIAACGRAVGTVVCAVWGLNAVPLYFAKMAQVTSCSAGRVH